MNAERISAITIKVSDIAKSVNFYNKLLGLKILYAYSCVQGVVPRRVS